jgi:Tachylectin
MPSKAAISKWRKDLARNGSESWAAGNGNTISHGGWDQFNNVFSGGNGVIYAVDGDGNLRRYQDLNRNGGESWAQLDSINQTIGLAGPQAPFAGGWNNFRQLFSGGNGVIYAVDGDETEGNLRWYRDIN